MKQTTRIPAPVAAYQDDDGRPICGGCRLRDLPCGKCSESRLTAGYHPDTPCPIWGEGSKEVPNKKRQCEIRNCKVETEDFIIVTEFGKWNVIICHDCANKLGISEGQNMPDNALELLGLE